MKSLEVRSAEKKDVSALVELAEEHMPREATSEKRIDVLSRSMENLSYELLVAELDGKLVGFIDQWIICDFVHGAKLSYIQNLYVASRHRRKGIGSKLLEKVLKNAKEREVAEIHVVTEFDNKPAINLYRKHGLIKKSLQLEMEYE